MKEMLNEDFTAEGYGLIYSIDLHSAKIWFAPTKSLINVSRSSDFNWQENNSPVGKIIRLSVSGHRRSPFDYDCQNVTNITYLHPQEINSPILFRTRIDALNQLVAMDVPVVIGNYVADRRVYIGFHYFFGRIAVHALPNIGVLELLRVYTCDLTMCTFGSSYSDSCRWETQRVKTMVHQSSPIRIVMATCRGLFNDNHDFIFVPDGGLEFNDRIHVNCNDMVDGVPWDIFRGTRMKVICEAPTTYYSGFSGTTFYATVQLNRKLPPLPSFFYDMKKNDIKGAACSSLVARVQTSVSDDAIQNTYPEHVASLFNQSKKLKNELSNTETK